MVAQDHQVTGPEVGVDAAGGVGGDQRAAAELGGDPGGEGDLGGRVALVGVDPAGEDEHRHAAEAAGHQRAGVAGDLRHGQAGDLGGGHHHGVLHLLGERAEAGAEHQGDRRPLRQARCQGGRGGSDRLRQRKAHGEPLFIRAYRFAARAPDPAPAAMAALTWSRVRIGVGSTPLARPR